jgi:hypothetical protein
MIQESEIHLWAPYLPEIFEDKRQRNKKREADGVVSGIKFIITEGHKICCSKGPQAVPARPSGQGK